MDCIISPKNALLLDRLMRTIKTGDLIIDTTSKMLFQMVSDDKTKCCNLVVEDTFFISVKLKNRLLQINKHKFYIKKMKVLRVYTYDSVMVFEYDFDGYIYRHRLFTYETSIYTLSFTSLQRAAFDHNLFSEVLKQVKRGEVKIIFKEDFAHLVNEDNTIKFRCCDLNGVTFDLCLPTFKTILHTCKSLNEAILCWEGEGCPINVIFKSSTIQVSYFIAV